MKRLLPLALLGSLLLAGCRSEPVPAVTAAAPPSNDIAAAVDAKLHLASWEEVEQSIAEQKGKVVVLDVWSTWCQPCVKEFPCLVKLHEQHGDQVVCMSLNSNYSGAAGESPENALEEVTAFLVEQEATFQNFISTTPDLELYQKLESPSVPIVRVYDKTGKLHKQFDDSSGEYGQEGFSYEKHINPVVDELLAQ